jgi:uncharacterized membrane protein YdjX (TVP38/TMEM64 family)
MSIASARVLRGAVLGLLAIGIIAAWRWRNLFEPLALAAAIGQNPLAPLAFIALHVAASLFFVPRTLLALGAGMVFGMWWGVVWAAFGSVAGAVAGFLAARYIHSGFFGRAARSVGSERLAALTERVELGGWRMVAVVRLVPIFPHSLTNYALGLTRVRLGAYAVGSLLGQLPMTIAYAGLGTAGCALLCAGDWPHQVLWPSLIGSTALLLSLLIPALARRRWRQAALPVSVPVSVPGALPEA